MNSTPLVSIITPNYNSEEFIVQTIESVLSQTYQNWELLITDDCSTDNSLTIINSYKGKDDRIHLLKLNKNGGAAVCRNHSIREARGRYIAFLDSDDIWRANKLELQVSFMLEHNYDFTFTRYQKISESDELIDWYSNNWKKLTYRDMLSSNKIGCLTAMYDTSKVGKVYMPLIRKRQDYALWLKLLKKVKYAYCLDEVLANYRIRESSLSSSKVEMLKWNWKLFREVEKLSIIKYLY